MKKKVARVRGGFLWFRETHSSDGAQKTTKFEVAEKAADELAKKDISEVEGKEKAEGSVFQEL